MLTYFDSTIAIFKTLYWALNNINYYSENFRGGTFGLGGGGGYPRAAPHLCIGISLPCKNREKKNLQIR